MQKGKLLLSLLAAVFTGCMVVSCAGLAQWAEGVESISAQQARRQVTTGQALLVCACDDEKCKNLLLEDALLKSEFQSRLTSLAKNQEIIFYCN